MIGSSWFQIKSPIENGLAMSINIDHQNNTNPIIISKGKQSNLVPQDTKMQFYLLNQYKYQNSVRYDFLYCSGEWIFTFFIITPIDPRPVKIPQQCPPNGYAVRTRWSRSPSKAFPTAPRILMIHIMIDNRYLVQHVRDAAIHLELRITNIFN